MPDTPLIATTEELEALAKQLRRQKVIAVDTEADSFFHYVDKLCLIQIGHKGGIVLVDPLELPPNGLEPLAPVFADPKIRKIFHAADYDLYVLQRYGGLQIRNLFDTMISAQLLGYRSVGLAALVKDHFDIEMSKDQQRTDWSRRPLRDAQIQYAASDVEYLMELAVILERELRDKGRLAWAQAEFEALEEKVWPEREFDADGFLRIKGARQLSPRGRAVLRELYVMRDQRARERDRPPFKVLGNGTLLELAQKPPRSKRALVGRRGITDLVVRRLGGDILDAVGRGLDAPIDDKPEPKANANPNAGGGRRRLDRRAEQLLDRLKAWRARRAKDLDIDPGVFCPNSALEEVAWTRPKTAETLVELPHIKRWWAEEFGPELLELIGAPDPAKAAGAGGTRSARSGSTPGSGSSRGPSRSSRSGRRKDARRKNPTSSS